MLLYFVFNTMFRHLFNVITLFHVVHRNNSKLLRKTTIYISHLELRPIVTHCLNQERRKKGMVRWDTRDYVAYLVPGVAQVVAIGVGHSDEGLNGVNVLLLHFWDARAGGQQGEPRQGLHIRIPLQLRQKNEKVVCQNTARYSIRTSQTLILQLRLQYLYAEDACYPDGKTDAFQTQWSHLGVIAIL